MQCTDYQCTAKHSKKALDFQGLFAHNRKVSNRVKKHKTSLPLPLCAINNFQPTVEFWQKIDAAANNKGKSLPNWDDICYIPLAVSTMILNQQYGVEPNFLFEYAMATSALAVWRQYKQIYHFTPELRDLLFEQADDDLIIPTDVLYQLPYKSIYIDISDEEIEQGFFIFFDQDFDDFELSLRFLRMCRDNGKAAFSGTLVLPLGNKKGWTISDATRKLRERVDSVEEYYIQQNKELTMKYVQLVLYLCSQNAEISDNVGSVQKNPVRQLDIPTHKPQTTIHFRDLNKWDVGIKIAQQIRSANAQSESGERKIIGDRNSPRPHTRRGHWHHYWIGSRKEEGTRMLILKWVAPTFVGGNSDDIIATQHNQTVSEDN